MSPALLLFGVGGLLLVTGVLGGGFELRELKVPRVGRLARVLATGAGGACIVLGLGLNASPGDNGGAGAAEKKPVHFVIHNKLGENQLAEQASVVFDGRHVGDLTVTEYDPEDFIELSAEPGRHDYTVSVLTTEYAEDGSEVDRQGSGQGSIVVESAASYQLAASDTGDRRDVTLLADTRRTDSDWR